MSALHNSNSFSLFFRAEALDTGSPDPRSSERRCLSSLSGTLSACPTSFLHTKFPSLKSQGYSQTLTPSIPRILEGADQSFFLSSEGSGVVPPGLDQVEPVTLGAKMPMSRPQNLKNYKRSAKSPPFQKQTVALECT